MKSKRPANRKTYRVQSVDRALDIMACFDFQNRQFPLTAMARLIGLNKTAAVPPASNLVARGNLQFDVESSSYCVGMQLFELGSIVFSSFSPRKAASRHMTRSPLHESRKQYGRRRRALAPS